ncbi:MAG: HIT family protein [Ktedonobacterales bacterium]
MADCVFCEQQSGRIPVAGGAIFDDDLVFAHHYSDGDEPAYLGHLLIETKRHVPGFAGLTASEAEAVGLLVARVSRALTACTGATHVYAESYGEVVPHLHIHITARYANMPPQFLRWKVSDWPDAPRGDAAQVAELAAALRTFVANEAATTAPTRAI